MINKLLTELKTELNSKHKENFTGLVLFGSYAKGVQNKNSDVDLIVSFKKLPKNRKEKISYLFDIIFPLEEKYGIEINPLVCESKNLKKTILATEISDYAKIIVDKKGFFKKLFDSIKNDFKEGIFEKIQRNSFHILKFKNV
ncbi:MAG: nucleotidyltransferase family protein [Nanoarchaeota archaeon]